MPKHPEPHQLARNAADSIRELNHITHDHASMPYAGEISSTVIALIDLAARLPQTLSQLEAGLRAIQERDGILLDHDGSVRTEVNDAVKGLQDASAALDVVGKALADASAPLFHMGAPYPPHDDD